MQQATELYSSPFPTNRPPGLFQVHGLVLMCILIGDTAEHLFLVGNLRSKKQFDQSNLYLPFGCGAES